MGLFDTKLLSERQDIMVNIPKQRKTFCKGLKCKKHTLHKVTQYKTAKNEHLLKDRDVMRGNNLGMVAKLGLFITRKLRPQRRLFYVWSAQNANSGSKYHLSDACTLS